jgi:hypothetical protein
MGKNIGIQVDGVVRRVLLVIELRSRVCAKAMRCIGSIQATSTSSNRSTESNEIIPVLPTDALVEQRDAAVYLDCVPRASISYQHRALGAKAKRSSKLKK